QTENEYDDGAWKCHTGHRGDRSGYSAQAVADDHADIGRDQARDGLSNLQSCQEVIAVEPVLTGDQMLLQIRDHTPAETGRSYIKEDPEQLHQADFLGLVWRIIHG